MMIIRAFFVFCVWSLSDWIRKENVVDGGYLGFSGQEIKAKIISLIKLHYLSSTFLHFRDFLVIFFMIVEFLKLSLMGFWGLSLIW